MAETVGEMLVKIGADISDMKAKFAAIESSMRELESSSRSAFGRIGDVVKDAFVFTGVYEGLDMLKEGIKSAIEAGIEWNSNMQQNQIAFTQLLHSSEQAQAMLQQLTTFAAQTPFELPQVEDLAKKLLAFGFSAQQVIPILTAVGDAAAGLGIGADGAERLTIALGQLAAKGKVQADEMLQLVEAGVPAWDILAKAMHVSTAQLQEMVSKGVVPADKAIQALVAGMEQRFPHMMEAQSKSFAGLMSTLKDNTEMFLGAVMKPAFDWLSSTALPALTNAMGNFAQTAQKNGLGAAFISMFPPSVQTGLKVFAQSVHDAMQEIKDSFGGDLGPRVAAFIQPFKSIGPAISDGLVKVGAAIHMIAAALAGDTDRFHAIANALQIPPSVQQAILNVISALKQAYQIVAPAFKATFQQIVTFFKTNWPEISAAVRNVMSVIAAVFNAVWPIIKVVVLDTLRAIMDGIRHAVDLILSIIKLFADLFTGNWRALWGDIKRILSDALAILWDYIQVWGIGKVLRFFGGFGRMLGSHISSAWEGVKSIFSRALSWLYSNTIGRFNAIRDAVAGAMGGLRSRIAGVWDGIVGAIRGAINRMIGAINGMIDGLNHIHVTVPSWVPGLGGKSWGVSIPHIPYLATGGIVTQPTTAVVGEAGPEAVVPLAKLPALIAEALQAALPQQPQPAAAAPATIVVPVYLDGREIARATAPYIDQELAQRRNVVLRAQGVTG